MVQVNKFFQIIHYMKDNGKKINLKEQVVIFTQMEILMKVTLNKVENKVKESTLILMDQLIMDNGIKIKEMDLELKRDQMQVLTKGNNMI